MEDPATPTTARPRHVRPLQRHAASELLAGELRNEILEGTLRPGEPLREQDISDRYGVARNTVREALRLLTRDGLGMHEVHRGVSVRVFTPDEVRDIFALRRVLEETSAERVRTLTPDEVEQLEFQLRQSEEAFDRGDSQAGLNANLAFHRELVKLAGNRRTDAVFDLLLTEIRLILASMEDTSGGPWIDRNRQLLAALLEGDADTYRAVLRDYLDAAREDAIDHLP